MIRLCSRCGFACLSERCDCGGTACGCADCQRRIAEMVRAPGMVAATAALCAERLKAAGVTLDSEHAVPVFAVGVVCAGPDGGRGRPVVVTFNGIGEDEVPTMLRNLADRLDAAARADKFGSN